MFIQKVTKICQFYHLAECHLLSVSPLSLPYLASSHYPSRLLQGPPYYSLCHLFLHTPAQVPIAVSVIVLEINLIVSWLCNFSIRLINIEPLLHLDTLAVLYRVLLFIFLPKHTSSRLYSLLRFHVYCLLPILPASQCKLHELVFLSVYWHSLCIWYIGSTQHIFVALNNISFHLKILIFFLSAYRVKPKCLILPFKVCSRLWPCSRLLQSPPLPVFPA